MKFLALALGLALLVPAGAHAAVDRAVVLNTYFQGANFLGAAGVWLDGSTPFDTFNINVPIGNGTSSAQIMSAIDTALSVRASEESYPLTNGITWSWLRPSEIQALINASAPTAMTFSSPTVTLGTAFQPSATRASDVRATFRIANVLTLTGGAAGDIVMEQADNSGMSTNVVELGRCGNSNTGGLVVGLTLNDAVACQVSGIVGAGKYIRYRSATTVGTPTYTVLGARQVLLPSN